MSYTSSYTNGSNYDMYVALYDSHGVLREVKINNPAGSFNITDGETYTVKAFFWEKDTMTPVNGAETITETIR